MANIIGYFVGMGLMMAVSIAAGLIIGLGCRKG